MNLAPGIFKAYDVRGVYSAEINEEGARAIGAAFVAYLKATHIAVGRDMRLSSPAVAAAFGDGETSQGAGVVDYGMIPTDMLYFAVARDGHDGGVEITASHNPKQYNGMKMVRQEAFPLSGEEGITEIREMIATNTIPAPASRRGQVTTKDVLEAYVNHVMSSLIPRAGRPSTASPAAGAAVGGPWRRSCSTGCRARRRGCASRSMGDFRITRRTRSSTRTGATSSRRSWRRKPTSASRGTATRIAVSSSPAPASSCPAISSRRSSRKRF